MPARDDDLNLITDAARDAGEIARRFFGGSYKQWDKGKGQPVTEADLAIDTYLHDALLGARADYGWLSEESVDNTQRLATAKTFVVDPIDGTIAFLKGKPHFTISIAVVEAGRPTSAVVFNPITLECFDAIAGHGTRLNGEAVHVSACTCVEGCRMLAPKSLFEHPGWSRPPNTPWPTMQVDQRNSIAYRLALVAAGQFDAMIALSSKHDWDIAAGDLLVNEAGGFVGDHLGNVLRYNGTVPIQGSLVAAGPTLYPLLIKRVQNVRLPER